jgi:hypothetical protein
MQRMVIVGRGFGGMATLLPRRSATVWALLRGRRSAFADPDRSQREAAYSWLAASNRTVPSA